jgi:hypothetical protein
VILFSSYQPAASTPYGKRRPAGCASSASLASIAGVSSSSKGSSLPAGGLFSSLAAAVAAAAVGAATWAAGGSAASVACVLLLLLLACLLYWRSAASARTGSSHSWREWFASIAQGGAVMWYRPLWATVQGGYTISPREDANGGYSPECLVTCILKVRMLYRQQQQQLLHACLCRHGRAQMQHSTDGCRCNYSIWPALHG